MTEVEAVQRRTGLLAAVLFLVGLLTGGFASSAMTGQIPADGHAALASHLNALLGGLWVMTLAWSMPMLRYSPTGLWRLALLTAVPNFANWAITALKALWRVAGISRTGETYNDIIFGLLTVFVVVPSLVAASAWVWGFMGPSPKR